MFNKILIANRGEISIRVIRAARELGVKTVAIYSKGEEDSMHIKYADESVCVGPSDLKDSYLNIPAIISAAEVTGAEAIHPGYGFLSENPDFSEICAECGIAFIGPPSSVIRKMGDKIAARHLMSKMGVPIVPGSIGTVKDLNEAALIARKIKYPVMIKAASGGGGKGIRIVESEEKLFESITVAQEESKKSFGNSDVYIEKLLKNPKHVEAQIIADNFGNVLFLGERDCSIQRRHQKLIEETPSPVLNEKIRRDIKRAAVKGAKGINYINAGTMEFLVDGNKNFYFIEMNTRIQVEHPVTEMVTGIDIVKEQIRIAANLKMNFDDRDITPRGHSIKCRVNAENPFKEFMPSSGVIEDISFPLGGGVRIDTHIFKGYHVSPNYDSLIAKVVTSGSNRTEAIERMKRVLSEFVIKGIDTTIPFILNILNDQDFIEGNYDINYVGDLLK